MALDGPRADDEEVIAAADLERILAASPLPSWRAAVAWNGSRYRKYKVHGVVIYLNIGESPMMLARALGTYEPAKFSYLERFLKEGMAFVDVGANKGDFALFAAAKGARPVYAFEPAPDNCAWIRRSITANGLDAIRLFEAALSDETGEATLFLGAKSGWHSLIAGLPQRNAGTRRVRTFRLDDVLAPDARVDCLKIDVEGAENRVVTGAARTLARHRPVVLVDIHPGLGADVPGLFAAFKELGYTAFLLRAPERPLTIPPTEALDLVFRTS